MQIEELSFGRLHLKTYTPFKGDESEETLLVCNEDNDTIITLRKNGDISVDNAALLLDNMSEEDTRELLKGIIDELEFDGSLLVLSPSM